MQQSGGAEKFCCAGKGVVEMRGTLGWSCPPLHGGLPTAWLSVGYLFIIYGV